MNLKKNLIKVSGEETWNFFIETFKIITIFDSICFFLEEDNGEGEDEKENVIYFVSNEIHFTSPKMSSLVLIKRGTLVEADKAIHPQLRIVTLSDGPAYETLHAISKTMAPYFKSYVKESGRADRDGDKMAPSVEKKIAELEMGLLHLQQNIDIPEISLPVHPVVLQVIKQCSDEGRKPKVADFGNKVEDSTFLNQLQNGVNRWIKEIQKVSVIFVSFSFSWALVLKLMT